VRVNVIEIVALTHYTSFTPASTTPCRVTTTHTPRFYIAMALSALQVRVFGGGIAGVFANLSCDCDE
jgi:hypothetical protein